ncbi:MAG: hypothetical protein HKL95_05225 [Phycisphaerae bacterium]|nr:hypothetical protein [Phycisphaerae bacterium]
MIERFFYFIFGIHAPPAGAHSTLHLSLGISHPWLMVLVMLAVAVLGWWTYRAQAASRRARIWMGTLRGLVLLLVALLFCRPMLVSENTVRTPAVVAIWVDSSLAMSLRDGYINPAMRAYIRQIIAHRKTGGKPTSGAPDQRPTRFAVALQALAQPRLNWLFGLARRQKIMLFTGGSRARLFGQADNPVQLRLLLARLANQKPTATNTDVPRVAAGILRRLQGQPVSAVILVTSGRSTPGSSAEPAQRLAQASATPAFAIRVGQVHTPFDVALRQARAPRHAFVEDPVPVDAVLHVMGAVRPVQATVHLYRQTSIGGQGREVAAKTITVRPGNSRVALRMIFHPRQPGQYHLMLRVDPIAGEMTTRANTAADIVTNVVKTRIRVLFVDGYPRWEYRYLKNDLAREKTLLVSCLLLSADNNFAQQGSMPITHFPETQKQMNMYDVLVLGDADPDYFSTAQQKMIVKFVGQYGGGFGMIAGPRYSPDAYRNTPLAALLPIIPDRPDNPELSAPPNAPFEVHLTAAGRQSPLFDFFSSAKKNLWQAEHLPPLYWYMPVLGLKPSAVVLADLPSRLINGRPAPLLVMGRYGAGRTMFSAICDTWRWRYYHGAPEYKSYWLEMVRMLARSRAFGLRRPLELTTAATHVDVGSSVRVRLRVNDSLLLAQMPRQIRLQATNGEFMEPLILSRVQGKGNVFEGALTPQSTGTIRISAAPGELPANVRPLALVAQQPDREFLNLSADPAALRRLVQKTGGQVLTPVLAAKLAELVPDRSLETVFRQSQQIWNKPIALLLIVVLLTVEWILRKRAGLI